MRSDDQKHNFDGSRRAALLLLGAALFSGRSQARSDAARTAGNDTALACVVTPEQTEGPYFVDRQLNRSDIRTDPADGSVRPGVPLALVLHLASVGKAKCTPLAGAIVDIWHCDAAGVYSDVMDSTRKKFLRGYQVADANGDVRFTTIYPGWYQGRAVHIHFKVRVRVPSGESYEFASQLYFDEAITDRVFAHKAYAGAGPRRMRNDADGLFRNGGRRLLLSPVENGQGYTATFDVGFRMT